MSDYKRWPFEDNNPINIMVPGAERFKRGDLTVIVSTDHFDFFNDGSSQYCKHVSISHPDRYPTWDEIKHARDRFMDRNRTVYQVLPPENEYVDHHPNCFHLWMPIIARSK